MSQTADHEDMDDDFFEDETSLGTLIVTVTETYHVDLDAWAREGTSTDDLDAVADHVVYMYESGQDDWLTGVQYHGSATSYRLIEDGS